MGYGDGCRIERHQNGWEATIRDPEIVAKNEKRDAMKYDDPKRPPWIDPNKSYVFADLDKLMAFLKTALPKMKPEADFETAFDTAASSIDD